MTDRDDESRDDEQRDSETAEQAASSETHTRIVEFYVAARTIARSVDQYGSTDYGRGPGADDEQWANALKSLALAMTGTGLGRGLVRVRLSDPEPGTGQGSVWLLRTRWPEEDNGTAAGDGRSSGDSPLAATMGKMSARLRGARIAAMLHPDEPAVIAVRGSGAVGEIARAARGYVPQAEEPSPTSGWLDTSPEFLNLGSERSSGSGFGEDAGVNILPGDHRDYSDEQVEPFPDFTREPVPHEEQTRRGMLIALGLGFAALFIVQLGLALVLNDDDWNRVGPVLTSASTLLAAGLGYALGHYFSGKK